MVMGDLKYTNSEGVLVDCTLAVSGDCVPLDVVEMNTIATSAKFVLVVEKDAVIQRLLKDSSKNGHLPSMVMITVKGVPWPGQTAELLAVPTRVWLGQ